MNGATAHWLSRATLFAATLLLLAGGVGPAPAAAQEPTVAPADPADPADPIDRWVLERMRQNHVPGLSLAVVQNGEVVKLRGYGLASVELAVPASPSTVYRLASITKAFTGAAVMLLAQEGRLSLDDSIEAHLDGLPPEWHGITLRRMLTHTSGLPDLIVESPSQLEPLGPTLVAALDSAAKLPMQFEPGTAWRYNQTNYALVQAVVERLSGQSFPDFVTGRLLRPAGMARTVFGGASDVVEGRGPWYSRLEETDDGLRLGDSLHRIHVDYPDFMLATGGLNSTVEDLVKWDRALRDRRILTPESLAALWQPVRLDGTTVRLDGRVMGYALGWSTLDRPGHRAVWASGGNTVALHRYLDDDLTVIVLTNCQGGGPNELAEGVAGFYVPAIREDPVFLRQGG
ncbi:MAG: serine hydrolase domain-containing protein [Gemmatimonadota bacterium]